jgi:hypothetical protein
VQALAYVLHKSPYAYPIIGQRKVEHLLANIEALKVELSQEDMDKIDTAVCFDPGFPMNFIFQDNAYSLNLTAADVTYTRLSVHLRSPPHQQPLRPCNDI